MKILVTGGAGFIGPVVVRQAIRGSHEVVNLDSLTYAANLSSVAPVPNAPGYAFEPVSIIDRPALDRVFDIHRPDAVTHVAAESHVDRSIDYVFPGEGTTPLKPDDATGPLGAYGQTKLEGENTIRASGARHSILSTSWVFSARGQNFVKTMLRIGAERDWPNIVADKVGGPAEAGDIAQAILEICFALAEGYRGGTYHYSGAPDVSWADFAREIFRQAELSPAVVDIPTSEYPTPASRPLNSRLYCSTLEADFGIKRPDWKAGLAEVMKELRV